MIHYNTQFTTNIVKAKKYDNHSIYYLKFSIRLTATGQRSQLSTIQLH